MEKKEILIVDDDRGILRTLEKILVEAGYSVTPHSSGKEAIKTARDKSPDLIILDIMMPDMDGGEVAQILKNDPETRDIPIIFLSALITENEEKSSSRKHGIILLSKPFESEKLIKLVEGCI